MSAHRLGVGSHAPAPPLAAKPCPLRLNVTPVGRTRATLPVSALLTGLRAEAAPPATTCAPAEGAPPPPPPRGSSTATAKKPAGAAPFSSPSSSTSSSSASSPRGGGGGGGTGDEGPNDEGTGDSLQIGLDPFSQQLILSGLTAAAATAIAYAVHLDLSTALRTDDPSSALALAAELSAPVLLLLLGVAVPRWAPPFKGSELERLRHNYYMTAQVLQLYLAPDSDDEEEEGGGGLGDGGGDERERVRRRLRLEQTVGWGTISSALALMQAFTLQPWNTPTANPVLALALLGRSAQQLANEFLVRGAGWGLISGWVAGALSAVDTSDGLLYYGKVVGGPDAAKYAAGLALVALAVPGALWEARSARNFVRASVVGPVRDAAIFCTGDGVNEPAYCDPAGFAMMAARRPANAAPVADVVIRTRSWRSGPESSFSSVSSISSAASLGSLDLADLPPLLDAAPPPPSPPALGHDSNGASTAAGAAAPPSLAASSSALAPPQPTAAASSSEPPSASSQPPAGDGGGAASPSAAANGAASSDAGPSPAPPAAAAASPAASASAPSPAPPAALPQVGPTVSASSAAFEWDSEDMGVLLRVETLQDKIAFWSALYFQLLAAFAINGAFLASNNNLLASFATAWLLRTGPLLMSELRARTAVDRR